MMEGSAWSMIKSCFDKEKGLVLFFEEMTIIWVLWWFYLVNAKYLRLKCYIFYLEMAKSNLEQYQ